MSDQIHSVLCQDVASGGRSVNAGKHWVSRRGRRLLHSSKTLDRQWLIYQSELTFFLSSIGMVASCPELRGEVARNIKLFSNVLMLFFLSFFIQNSMDNASGFGIY